MNSQEAAEASSGRQFDVLLTAAQAYPALERQFLSATQDIVASFRIFDPWTKLRATEAQEVGDHWFDLVAHTLNRGVQITLTISDFDPIVRAQLHHYAWRCLHGLIAAAEASDCPQNLTLRIATHPARVGVLPRLLLWPRMIKEIKQQVAHLTQDGAADTKDVLRHVPNLRPLVKETGNKLAPRLLQVPPLVPVSHHQKLAVFDNARLYIGGLDLNDRRFDTPQHDQDSPQTWHDVQVLADGPIAAEARAHVLAMHDVFAGDAAEPTTHLLRTMSAKRQIALPYLSPRLMVVEIADMHSQQIAQSEELIFFETQFLRDEGLARDLAKRAGQQPNLTLITMLPAAPEDIAFSSDWGPDAAFGEHLQVKCIDIVQQAFADRVFFGSPVQPKRATGTGRAVHFGAPIIYLHAKVSIFDERMGIVSSANLNGRSLNWDTEAGIKTEHPQEVAQLKNKCFSHWLGPNADDALFNMASACDAWAARAAANARKAPEQREGFVLPYSAAAAEDVARALPGVPPEMA